MKREEAVSLIKEIDEECKDIRGTSIMLMEPNQTKMASDGFEVHIKLKADHKRMRCLETIAQQYGYKVNNNPADELVVIYTPIKTMQ